VVVLAYEDAGGRWEEPSYTDGGNVNYFNYLKKKKTKDSTCMR
jgi:hypothetical protein